MVSYPAAPMVQSQIFTHLIFVIFSALLLVSVLWQYLLPWQLAGPIIKKHGRDPRPRMFYKFILFTVLSLLFSSVLNVVFLSQDVPSTTSTNSDDNEGASLHVKNLSVNGWIALMVLATIAQQIPYALLFLTLLNILQSRWYAFIKAEEDYAGYKTGDKQPPFLGWRGKEGTSLLTAFLLVFLPLSSRIILSVGLGTTPNPTLMVAGDYSRFEQFAKAVMWLDGMRAATAFIALVDIAVSSFCLSKRLRAGGYNDSITTSISRIFMPFLTVLAVQIVVASGIQTLGPPPSDSTIAAVGLSTVVVGDAVMFILLICFSVLYAALPRWLLAAPKEAYTLELPSLAKENARAEV